MLRARLYPLAVSFVLAAPVARAGEPLPLDPPAPLPSASGETAPAPEPAPGPSIEPRDTTPDPALAAAPPAPRDAPNSATDPLPGPEPFADSAPLLPEMWRLVSARDVGPKALDAGLRVLDDWLSRPTSDPLARATGEYLRARILTRRNKTDAARAAWEALATTPGAFSDEARLALANLEPKKKSAAAAHWLLTRSPGARDYLDGVERGVQALGKRGAERAAELLTAALRLGMADDTRRELLLMLADLLPDDAAERLVLHVWWAEDGAPDKRVTKRLKALKVLPGADEAIVRDAFAASRKDAGKAARTLEAKAGKGSAHATIALAALDRFDEDDAKKALLSLDKAGRALADTPFVGYARGLILRKLDRDADAVNAFEEVIDQHPDHPLASLARAQASVLLRALGKPADADQHDVTLLASAPPGELHRDALWRLGFGAVLRGDAPSAERWLRDLEQRHGGDPDRHSFCWFERARYWRGRAAQLGGDNARARDLLHGVIARFPAGWYALLARDRLGLPLAGPTPRSKDAELAALWDVPRDDPMATAIALYRLGAESDARETFEALLDARQLPGNGRKLLADLLDLEGESQKADRVLRYAAIPATMPGDDPDEVYRAWFPFSYGEAVSDAAHDNGLPSQLLAGIVSVETRFKEKGRSKVGAIGLAQLMPSTGQAVGRKLFGDSFKASQLWDPETNLAVAAKYLGSLLDRFSGHPALAVLAYNAGPAPVKRWLSERGTLELDAFVETIPYEQARRYVMRVLSDAEIYRRLYDLESRPLAIPRALARGAAER